MENLLELKHLPTFILDTFSIDIDAFLVAII